MTNDAEDFLFAVLGSDGARVLLKAVTRAPILVPVLVPRTILSWLDTSVRLCYEGEIPGIENSYISIKKTETAYSGALTIGDAVHSFENRDIYHVAAAMGVSLGLKTVDSVEEFRRQDLEKLGKSIDLLVKSRVVSDALKKEAVKKVALLPDRDAKSLGEVFQEGHVGNTVWKRTEKLGDGIWHHVFRGNSKNTEAAVFHHLSTSQDPSAPAIAQIHGTQHDNGPLSISFAQVRSGYESGGYGKQLYLAALRQHGSMESDTHVSRHADKVWQWLGAQPGVRVHYGAVGSNEPHIATLDLHKIEMPGKAAAARAPIQPQAPDPQKKAPANSNLKPGFGKKEINVSKNEAEKKCGDCGGRQIKAGKVKGCLCFRDLVKSSPVECYRHGDSYSLHFNGTEWDSESMSAFLAAMK